MAKGEVDQEQERSMTKIVVEDVTTAGKKITSRIIARRG